MLQNMVILRMWGGLGNQMFIYAFARRLIKEGRTAKADMNWYENFSSHNGYELERIFDISFPIANSIEVSKYTDNKIGILHTIKRRAFKSNSQKSFSGHKAITFYQEVFRFDDVYLQGYWQSEKYFSPIEGELRRKFIFDLENRDNSLKYNDFYQNFLSCKCKVSLHVRRGDYLSERKISFNGLVYQLILGKTPELGGVCTEEYYSNAIDLVENKTVNPHYYVFSDDIEWCKINLRLPENRYTFVDINKKEDSYLDMYLMSQCNHNIIANSSFSWWGAWLNSHDDKIVIAPDRWFKDGYSGDIIPEDWITVSTI